MIIIILELDNLDRLYTKWRIKDYYNFLHTFCIK